MRPVNSIPTLAVWVVLALLSIAVYVDRSPAAAMQDALPANHSLVAANLSDFQLLGVSAADARANIVSVTNGPGLQQALQVRTLHRAANDYDIQFSLPLPSIALKRGDLVWMGAWARMLKSDDQSGQGTLGIVLEQKDKPFSKLLQHRVSIGSQWQQVCFPARSTADYAAGSLHLSLRVGGAAQTLEIGDVQLVQLDDAAAVRLDDLPQTRMTYAGRDKVAPWRKSAEQRIDKIRKAPLTVHVLDADGRPVAGATVRVEMRQHAFPFGCVYDPIAIVGPDAQTPQGRGYGEHFAELFNVGVDEYAMKYPAWERSADRQLVIDAVDWMSAHGIRVRGHCLVWPGWPHLPADMNQLKDNPAALTECVKQHIRDEVSEFAGRVTEWDVVNEPAANNDLMKILGDDAMADWFKVAHQADPSARLLLNETDVPTNPPDDAHYDVLYRHVKSIQQEGGPIGGIGMQAHFSSTLTSIPDLQQIYDRFATLGLPVEITELDINVTDEQLQADYLRDFMTFSFSHPNISGIMLWGFVEGHHWRPDAALWHADWTPKPAGQAWLDLVKKTWWTDETLTTDTNGCVSLRGFLGDYTITTSAQGQSQTTALSLPRCGRSVEVLLK
jgi:GH35 family endo-1,4-beta-xylanase